MSSMQETQAKAEAKTEELSQCAKDSATEAKDRTADAAHSATDSVQHGKDQSAGFLQQTGEQMKSMTQGAVDTVKSTLGVGDKK
ncbi:late embryogenesis abundant protein 2 [Humulus lupulus]|uniref:late embryogenesis abundant protein 2 n=1 Tax=Humulus lupulus TaxID=3486 RepID=UPI002B4095E2|nr:late embryogenesis abundant protein 2 [Humulus lupulus]